jgi:cytochrome c biogenesis protein CcmG/thiol:disulfide interchange protein DsbE
MRVQWLYALEALFGLIGIVGAAVLARRIATNGKPPRNIRAWLPSIAIAGVSLAAFAGAAFLVLVAQRPLNPAIRQTGHSLAAFRFQSVADDSWHSLGDYRGKIVLLNVWATWCGPCRQEIPELERIQKELGAQGVVVLMVSSEEPRPIREYLARSPISAEQGYVSEALDYQNIIGIESRPLSFIVDRQGIAREFLIGAGNSKSFSALLRKYL